MRPEVNGSTCAHRSLLAARARGGNPVRASWRSSKHAPAKSATNTPCKIAICTELEVFGNAIPISPATAGSYQYLNCSLAITFRPITSPNTCC
jgi:hypothetical protein